MKNKIMRLDIDNKLHWQQAEYYPILPPKTVSILIVLFHGYTLLEPNHWNNIPVVHTLCKT